MEDSKAMSRWMLQSVSLGIIYFLSRFKTVDEVQVKLEAGF